MIKKSSESEGFKLMRYFLVYARDMNRAIEDLKNET